MAKADNKESPPEGKTCGLVMPISSIDGCNEAHWIEVRGILSEALQGLDLSVKLVSEAETAGVIQGRIINNLYLNDLVICDVSCKNPNVMFELGMRLAFDKPTIIIKDSVTDYSFDTGVIEHLTYPRDLHYHQIQTFKLLLKDKVQASLKPRSPSEKTFLEHFGSFVVAKIDQKPIGVEDFVLKSLEEITARLDVIQTQGRGLRVRTMDSALSRFSDDSINPQFASEMRMLANNIVKNVLSKLSGSEIAQARMGEGPHAADARSIFCSKLDRKAFNEHTWMVAQEILAHELGVYGQY